MKSYPKPKADKNQTRLVNEAKKEQATVGQSGFSSQTPKLKPNGVPSLNQTQYPKEKPHYKPDKV